MRGYGPSGSVLSSTDFPLNNLILYMPFRILAYSSNILSVNFDRMDSMLACGTLKKTKFLRKSRSFSERAPDMKLTCFNTHPLGSNDLSNADFNVADCPSVLSFVRVR